jgi:hypothetical protein
VISGRNHHSGNAFHVECAISRWEYVTRTIAIEDPVQESLLAGLALSRVYDTAGYAGRDRDFDRRSTVRARTGARSNFVDTDSRTRLEPEARPAAGTCRELSTRAKVCASVRRRFAAAAV